MSNVVPFTGPTPTPALGAGHAYNVVALLPVYIELAQRIANTEFVPTALRRRPEAVLAALMSGAERGLGPMESLRSVHVIEGKPSLSAEAMRGLVLAAGHDIEIVESTATRATVVGRRAGSDSTSPPFTWTMDRARRARLANKQNWQTYPESMLLARASADLCRAVFPDVIAGLAATEEIIDLEPEATTARKVPARRGLAASAPAPAAVTAAVPTPDEGIETAAAPHDDLGGIPGGDVPSWAPTPPAPEPERPHDAGLQRRIHAEINKAFPDADAKQRTRFRHALAALVTRRRDSGTVTSSSDLDLAEQLQLSEILNYIRIGTASVADGPDDTVEIRAGGWLYTITLEPLTIVGQPEQPPARSGDE